jgi:hypothetical protein
VFRTRVQEGPKFLRLRRKMTRIVPALKERDPCKNTLGKKSHSTRDFENFRRRTPESKRLNAFGRKGNKSILSNRCNTGEYLLHSVKVTFTANFFLASFV